MFRDMLSGSRALVVGLVFFVLVVGGSLLYNWHVHRSSQEELEQTKQAVQQLGDRTFTRSAQDDVPVEVEPLGEAESLPETDNTETISEETAAFIDDAEIDVAADALDMLPEETSETENKDAPYGVSPYGFGPFPEIPADYPDQGVWSETALRSMEPGHELISRVRIELWNQGVRTIGGVYDNGHRLIYPIIDDVVYIEWADNPGIGGKPYVRRQLTTSAVKDQYHDDILKGIFPPHLTIYEFPDGGIDPYEFLDLSR